MDRDISADPLAVDSPAGFVAESAVLPCEGPRRAQIAVEMPPQPVDLDLRPAAARVVDGADMAGVLAVGHEHGNAVYLPEVVEPIGLRDVIRDTEDIQDRRTQP